MRRSGIKSFGTKPVGKVILILLAIAIVTPTFLFLGALIAIPAVLIFMLALPIYAGWKIPRQLAAAGLVVLLVSAPLAAAGDTSLLITPSPPVSSDTAYPAANGNGSVLANAKVNPYNGPPGSTFTFTVQYQPQYLPANYSTESMRAFFFMSTCPGATGNSSSSCTAGYPSYWNNTTVQNPNQAQTFVFTHVVSGVNIWWWQIGVSALNSTGKTVWIFLDPANGVGTVQGPVTGSAFDIFGYILPAFYEELFLYGGLSFGLALLAYVFFKTRERRRAEARAAAEVASRVPPVEPASTAAEAPGPPMGKPPPALAPQPEMACPNCKAVVYLNETNCWKCGAPLGSSGAGAPLRSEKN